MATMCGNRGVTKTGNHTGERSGQAFPLCNTGELLFFAYFTEAPLIVPDDATRAMLRERGYNVFSTAG